MAPLKDWRLYASALAALAVTACSGGASTPAAATPTTPVSPSSSKAQPAPEVDRSGVIVELMEVPAGQPGAHVDDDMLSAVYTEEQFHGVPKTAPQVISFSQPGREGEILINAFDKTEPSIVDVSASRGGNEIGSTSDIGKLDGYEAAAIFDSCPSVVDQISVVVTMSDGSKFTATTTAEEVEGTCVFGGMAGQEPTGPAPTPPMQQVSNVAPENNRQDLWALSG